MYHNRHYRMDLTQAPLIRFVKAQDQDGRWILARLQHHLNSDRSTSEKMERRDPDLSRGQGSHSACTRALPQPHSSSPLWAGWKGA